MTNAQSKAGAMKAHATDDNLLNLLAFDTTGAGVKVGDLLRERLAAAETAQAAHAQCAENAALAGEAAQAQHETEATCLQRQADRLRLAIERADARLAEVVAAERRVAGEEAAARAVVLAGKIEAAVGRYTEHAKQVAADLDAIEALQAELIRNRSAARDAGVECAAQLPHEARHQSEIAEDRERIVRERAPGVYGANGESLNGRPVEWIERRTTERVIIQHRHAPPNVLDVRAVLPDVDGGLILDRNRG